MRKYIAIALVLSLILAMLTGIAEASPSHIGLPVAHIVAMTLFIVVLSIHLILNRKALSRYFIPPKL